MLSLKKRLLKGDLVVGLMVSELRNPNFVHMLAQNGYDFLSSTTNTGPTPRRRCPILLPRREGRESFPS
jgi:2-keto-3-deoxy-L-rhamnonate aldolase RhmA